MNKLAAFAALTVCTGSVFAPMIRRSSDAAATARAQESTASVVALANEGTDAGQASFTAAGLTAAHFGGDWEKYDMGSGIVRYWPVGDDSHTYTMTWGTAKDSVNTTVTVPVNGELYVHPKAVFVDYSGRDNIQFVASADIGPEPMCDSDKTDVISNVMSGTCWETPYKVDKDTGAYTRACNKVAGSGCSATVTQSPPTPPLVTSTTWNCGSGGTVSYNPTTKQWGARGAQTCGAADPVTRGLGAARSQDSSH